MAEKRKKKRGVIVLWSILLAIVIGLGVLAFLQWNNIRAVWVNFRYTPEEQQALLMQNEEDIQKILDELNLSDITPLSIQQEELLNNGMLTEEDALKIIMGSKNSAEENAKIQQLMAKIYLLRSTFVGKLNALESQAKSEYNKSGGNVDLMEFAQKFLRQGAALESQCDAQMEQILAEMKQELLQTGHGTELIAQIRAAYQSEKSVKKAALLGKY